MDGNKKQDLKIVFVIVFIVIAMIVIGYFFSENKKDEGYRNDHYKKEELSYEDFSKEYSEFSEKFDIGEKNYYQYEEDMFSMKYSSRIEVTYKVQKEDKRVYIFLTNNTALEVIDAKVGIVYYDEEGNIVDTDYRYVYGLEKGNETCYTEYIRSKRVVDAKIIVNAKESDSDIKICDKVKAEIIDSDGSKMKVKVTNESNYAIERVTGEIVFYDVEGNIVSSSSIYVSDKIKPNDSAEDEIYLYEKKYNSYKIYINYIDI